METDQKIIDHCPSCSIQFHNAPHGFCKNRGCGTATLECKLQQEESFLKGEALLQIFLDLTKAYNTLNRTQTLETLEGCGAGPNIQHILHTFRDSLVLTARQGGHCSLESLSLPMEALHREASPQQLSSMLSWMPLPANGNTCNQESPCVFTTQMMGRCLAMTANNSKMDLILLPNSLHKWVYK